MRVKKKMAFQWHLCIEIVIMYVVVFLNYYDHTVLNFGVVLSTIRSRVKLPEFQSFFQSQLSNEDLIDECNSFSGTLEKRQGDCENCPTDSDLYDDHDGSYHQANIGIEACDHFQDTIVRSTM